MSAGHGLSERQKGLLLVAPPGLYAILLLAVPLGAVFLLSFWSQDFLTLDKNFSLKNYAEAFAFSDARRNAELLREQAHQILSSTDAGWRATMWAYFTLVFSPVQGFFSTLYMQLLLRSLLISGAVTVATVALAFPIAYFVSFHVPPQRKALWIFLITIPFWTSYLIRVFLWKVILGYNGVVNSALMGLGLISEPLAGISYSPNAVVLTLAHAFAPFAILPIFVALEKIDRSLLEASRDLGEGRAQTFLRVTLPLAMPGVVAAILIVFIPTIGDYVTPRLVGGPDGLMIANMIQTQLLRLNNAPMGAALAVISMAAVSAISLAIVLLTLKWLRGAPK